MVTYNPPSQYRPWTKIEDNMLTKMVKEGKNSAQIAEALGRTRAAVSGRKSTLGITQRMAPATGSTMPYTSFSKEKRGFYVEPAIELDEKTYPIVVPEKTPTVRPLEDIVLELIQTASALGLKAKVSFNG
jgi:hypothetical protein